MNIEEFDDEDLSIMIRKAIADPAYTQATHPEHEIKLRDVRVMIQEQARRRGESNMSEH